MQPQMPKHQSQIRYLPTHQRYYSSSHRLTHHQRRTDNTPYQSYKAQSDLSERWQMLITVQACADDKCDLIYHESKIIRTINHKIGMFDELISIGLGDFISDGGDTHPFVLLL